jgi:sec-independent protein translocase protein TatA
MGPIGVQEMIVIFLVALVLFGPKKLPELGKTIAKAVTEFRRAQSDLKATFEREMRTLEQESISIQEATRQATIDLDKHLELFGGGGEYGTETNPSGAPTDWHGVESGAPTTVSASEVPSAESHGSLPEPLREAAAETAVAETAPPVVHAAEETVARGALPAQSPANGSYPTAVEEHPAHETQST